MSVRGPGPACWLLVAIIGWAALSAAQPLSPEEAEGICPAMQDAYALCAADTWSGDCAVFVTAAERLAALYRERVAQQPQEEPDLRTSVWWGCGDATLSDVAMLLSHLPQPRAQALLREEPYQSLLRASAGGAPPPAPRAELVDCNEAGSPAAMQACAHRELESAEAEHQAVYQHCAQRVAPDLSTELQGSEQAWRAQRNADCEPDEDAYQDPALRAFARDQCLAQATRERTRTLLELHPECRPPR